MEEDFRQPFIFTCIFTWVIIKKNKWSNLKRRRD
jgi:hypothetical protein